MELKLDNNATLTNVTYTTNDTTLTQLMNVSLENKRLKDELKYQKNLLAEYQRTKKAKEPKEVKEYITNQKINGRNYPRKQRTAKYPASYHKKKQLRRELVDLINNYDDIGILKSIKEVLTDTELVPCEFSLNLSSLPAQSPPVLTLLPSNVQPQSASTPQPSQPGSL
jgi:hypothetical protein